MYWINSYRSSEIAFWLQRTLQKSHNNFMMHRSIAQVCVIIRFDVGLYGTPRWMNTKLSDKLRNWTTNWLAFPSFEIFSSRNLIYRPPGRNCLSNHSNLSRHNHWNKSCPRYMSLSTSYIPQLISFIAQVLHSYRIDTYVSFKVLSFFRHLFPDTRTFTKTPAKVLEYNFNNYVWCRQH